MKHWHLEAEHAFWNFSDEEVEDKSWSGIVGPVQKIRVWNVLGAFLEE